MSSPVPKKGDGSPFTDWRTTQGPTSDKSVRASNRALAIGLDTGKAMQMDPPAVEAAQTHSNLTMAQSGEI